MRAAASGRLEIALDRSARLDGPWVRGDDDRRWVVPAEIPITALTDDARDVAPPCPALVGIGQDADGEVYVDLEALPVLDVGSSAAAGGLVRLVAATLANTPLADELRVLVVGHDLPELAGRHEVLTVTDLTEAATRPTR